MFQSSMQLRNMPNLNLKMPIPIAPIRPWLRPQPGCLTHVSRTWNSFYYYFFSKWGWRAVCACCLCLNGKRSACFQPDSQGGQHLCCGTLPLFTYSRVSSTTCSAGTLSVTWSHFLGLSECMLGDFKAKKRHRIFFMLQIFLTTLRDSNH